MAESESESEKREEFACVTEEEEEEEKKKRPEKEEQVRKCFYCYKGNISSCHICYPSNDDDDDDDDKYAEDYPAGMLKEHRPVFDKLVEIYGNQIHQTYGQPIRNIKEYCEFGLMMKLADRAIREYNEKECNVFKYKILKIEKANTMISGYEQFFMTVKVLNLTLVTPIETFHIHAAKRIPDRFEEVLSCGPKGKDEEFSVFRKGKKKCC